MCGIKKLLLFLYFISIKFLSIRNLLTIVKVIQTRTMLKLVTVDKSN